MIVNRMIVAIENNVIYVINILVPIHLAKAAEVEVINETKNN